MLDTAELLNYLHGKIDPHNPRDPKYAALWAQIDAIHKANADILAAQPVKLILMRGV